MYLVYVLAVGLFDTRAVPGWTSVLAAVLVLGGVQLACIGIMGQYLERVYDEVKHRPLFMVWEDTHDELGVARQRCIYLRGRAPPV